MTPPTPGRLVCPRCGANNFDTQAACWKCGASLAPGAANTSPTPGVAGNGIPSGVPPSPAAPASVRPYSPPVDPGVAIWSAVALALLFPVVAVPVGIVFLMLDDRRRAEVGRVAILWGVVGTVFHTLVTGILVKQTVAQFMPLIGAATGGRLGSAPAEPHLNDPAPRLQFPGVNQ